MVQFATLVVGTRISKCPCCEVKSTTVERRGRNTCYLEDELNYLVSCLLCWMRDWDYYAERWAEYWSSR